MMVKKGSYKTRRFKRKIHRKWWVFQLRTKYYIGFGIYYSILGLAKAHDHFFKRVLRIEKRGAGIYEGVRR